MSKSTRFISLAAGCFGLALLSMLMPRFGIASGQPVVQGEGAREVVTVSFAQDISQQNFSGTLYRVPAGKRLIIETISTRVRQASGAFVASTFLTRCNAQNLYTEFVNMPQGTWEGSSYLAATHSVKLYADPSSSVSFSMNRSTKTAGGRIFVSFSGYLVDKP